MKMRPVLNLLSPPGGELPKADAAANVYGEKTAGILRLMSVQAVSPVQFHFPDYMAAVSATSYANAEDSDLGQVAEDMMSIAPEYFPWFARSSSSKERPGKYDSPAFGISQQYAQRSRRRLVARVREMQEGRDHMGVLLMPMLGGWSTFKDGVQGFGYDLISFVADTVNPFKPDEMHIAIVQGLGKGAVESHDAILMRIDRGSGEIKLVANRDRRLLRVETGSVDLVDNSDRYRQKEANYFDRKGGIVQSRPLEQSFFNRPMSWFALDEGELVRWMGHRPEYSVGITPFDSSAAVANLIGLLQYLHAELGPSQIEGAFLNSQSQHPHLLQHISPPHVLQEDRELGVCDPHFMSDEVMGTGKLEAPLIVYQVDAAFADRSELRNEHILKRVCDGIKGEYMLMTQLHAAAVLEATPGCTVRITDRDANASIHAITDMSYEAAARPDETIVMAMNAVSNGLMALVPDERHRTEMGTIYVFNRATIDSSGAKMALRIHSPE